MIVYYNNLINNEFAIKDFNDVLKAKALLDTSFHNKKQKQYINFIIKQLNQNCEAKILLQQHN